MSDNIIPVGNIYYGEYRHGFAGNICGIDGIAPTITCVGGGNRMPMILVKDEDKKIRKP